MTYSKRHLPIPRLLHTIQKSVNFLDLNNPRIIQPICLMDSFDEKPISSTPDWTKQQLRNQTERAEITGFGYTYRVKSYTPPFPPPQVPYVGYMRFMEPEVQLKIQKQTIPYSL